MSGLTVGSLFSGIGGIDLGLERAGMTVRWQVENEPYCVKVLAKHWPDVPRYGDIKTIDWTEVEPVDLICGGFPCQPVSLAGKRLAQDDERWLWPEFARAIRALRPRYALMENVPGLLSAGMSDVLGDLAALGYDAEWDCIPAAAVGAPHLRYRLLIVAYPSQARRIGAWQGEPGRFDGDTSHRDDAGRRCEDVVDAHSAGFQHAGEVQARGGVFGQGQRDYSTLTRPGWWDVEPNVGRVAHGIPARVDRLRGLGNAVVPQVAEWIGRRIVEAAS